MNEIPEIGQEQHWPLATRRDYEQLTPRQKQRMGQVGKRTICNRTFQPCYAFMGKLWPLEVITE